MPPDLDWNCNLGKTRATLAAAQENKDSSLLWNFIPSNDLKFGTCIPKLRLRNAPCCSVITRLPSTTQLSLGPRQWPPPLRLAAMPPGRSGNQVIKRAVAVQAQIAPLQDMGLVRRQRDSEVARLPGHFRAGDSVQAL